MIKPVEPTHIAPGGTALWQVHTEGEPIDTLISAKPGGKHILIGLYDPQSKRVIEPKAGDGVLAFTPAEIVDLLPALISAVKYTEGGKQ